MNILVTGGAGFIGRWVVRNLLQQGHFVFVIDNFSSGSLTNLAELAEHPNLRISEADIRDAKAVSNIFAAKPDACIHLAALVNVQESIDDPSKALAVNVGGTFNILEAARQTGTKVVFVSTCMVYGSADPGRAIDEEHPILPASPYAGTKAAAEALVRSYNRAYGLPTVILRPFNTYGPFQRTDLEGGVVAIFVRRALEGQVLEVFGDGLQTRDFLYVEDCAEFITRATFSERAVGEVINAGTNQDIAIKDLALLIGGSWRNVCFQPHIHPQSEIKKLVCDYSKAKQLLGWEPKTNLAEGIAEMFSWVKVNGRKQLRPTPTER